MSKVYSTDSTTREPQEDSSIDIIMLSKVSFVGVKCCRVTDQSSNLHSKGQFVLVHFSNVDCVGTEFTEEHWNITGNNYLMFDF